MLREAPVTLDATLSGSDQGVEFMYVMVRLPAFVWQRLTVCVWCIGSTRLHVLHAFFNL